MRTDGLRSREAWLWLPVRMQEPRAGRSPQACRGSPTPDPSPPRPNISGPETTCGGATARGQPLARAGPRTQTRPAPSQPALRAPSPSRDPHSKSGDYVQSCNTHTVEIHAKVEIGFCQTSYDPKSPPRKSSLFLQSCTATVQLSPARTARHRPTLPPGAPGQPTCVHGHLRTQGSRSADGHFRDTPRP